MTQEQKISGLLETKYIGRSLFFFERLSSTNDFLKNAADELPDGCAAVTTEQLAGKGRRGNKWLSPKGEMAAISVLLKGHISAAAPPVTLMFGLAAAQALSGLLGYDFLIKWPNDIVYDGKKVCGILCESRLTASGCSTVCGIGVNLTQSTDFFADAGIPHGASLKMLTGKTLLPEQVTAAILNRFEKIYTAASPGDAKAVEAFFADYSALCVTLGKEVKAVGANGEISGIAQSVNRDGSLEVLCSGKTVTLMASEVSVRGIMGYV